MVAGRFTANCPDCGWAPTGRRDRAMLRRSLGRHFTHEHGYSFEEALEYAWKVVPKHPDER